MIEIGKNFLLGMSSARQQTRQEKSKNKTLAEQAQQEANALEQAYEEQMDYLFRSSTERTQAAYEKARQQLAQLQARRAANGVTDQSASVVDEKQTSALQQAQTQQQVQRELSANAAETTRTFNDNWNKLRTAIARYYRQANRKSALGNFGRALASLFK